jgi:hypothetical protein
MPDEDASYEVRNRRWKDELETVSLLADGWSQKEVAKRLGVTQPVGERTPAPNPRKARLAVAVRAKGHTKIARFPFGVAGFFVSCRGRAARNYTL